VTAARASLTHLFLCREYPPAPHPPGGIGTYVQRIAAALADAGETVHVIGQRWRGAPEARVEARQGRLVVHRVPLDAPLPELLEDDEARQTRAALLRSACPVQTFAWQAARQAGALHRHHGVDVVEGADWEAPLAFCLASRSREGTRRPRYVVHLHSTSEQIYAANQWDRSVADFAPLARLEAATIRGADALLAPSCYVADEARSRYGLATSRVTVIPYPVEVGRPLDRDVETWRTGGICHVGRLEPRKGVFEWVQAWAMAGPPDLPLHFAGGDTPLDVDGGASVERALIGALPPPARRRVHFHGSLDRAALEAVLATCWAAVVPSRWDNLPYSCLEAMASGLPVLVSPHGGMREVVRDGVSGWVAADATVDALAAALRRAMEVPPEERRRMGDAATADVAARCDATRIARRHLDLKRTLVDAPAPAADVDEALDRLLDDLTHAARATPRPRRYSAMARSLQRMHVPTAEYWGMLSPAERGRLAAAALAHPLQAIRHLLPMRAAASSATTDA
jgi:glycosyltransferase involved in cell wall biosynthesis